MIDGTLRTTAQPPPRLIKDDELAGHSVVANSAMNRARVLAGVNSYTRELGFSPTEFLSECDHGSAPSWLDLCSGEGLALRDAAGREETRKVRCVDPPPRIRDFAIHWRKRPP